MLQHYPIRVIDHWECASLNQPGIGRRSFTIDLNQPAIQNNWHIPIYMQANTRPILTPLVTLARHERVHPEHHPKLGGIEMHRGLSLDTCTGFLQLCFTQEEFLISYPARYWPRYYTHSWSPGFLGAGLLAFQLLLSDSTFPRYTWHQFLLLVVL